MDTSFREEMATVGVDDSSLQMDLWYKSGSLVEGGAISLLLPVSRCFFVL